VLRYNCLCMGTPRTNVSELFNIQPACVLLQRSWTLLPPQIEAFLTASLPPADGAEPGDEEEADQQPAKKQKRNGAGFGSMLSPAMQEFLGCESMPRPQVPTLHRPH